MKKFIADNIGVQHGFFTRQGGVSDGIYASLNCGVGSGDDASNVAENLARVRSDLGVDELLTLYQVHSASCVNVTQGDVGGWSRPQADAMITDVAGVALGVLSADCTPVLFSADGEHGVVVAAAHAGWKGAVGGVLDSVIEAFAIRNIASRNIRAAIGPCIGVHSYEVSDSFIAPFLAQDPSNARFFIDAPKAGHMMFNMPAYVRSRLESLGVQDVTDQGLDTYSNEELFFSYRRKTHREELDYGRQISAIVIS